MPCQNQGFILDGFPKTYEQAKQLFARMYLFSSDQKWQNITHSCVHLIAPIASEEEEEEEEGQDSEQPAQYNKLLMPGMN